MERFFRESLQFSRGLFEQPRSGTLSNGKKELEDYLMESYSNVPRNAPLSEIDDLANPKKAHGYIQCKTASVARGRSSVEEDPL